MPQEPKRPVSELKPAELQSIVREIQACSGSMSMRPMSSAERRLDPLLECRQGVGP